MRALIGGAAAWTLGGASALADPARHPTVAAAAPKRRRSRTCETICLGPADVQSCDGRKRSVDYVVATFASAAVPVRSCSFRRSCEAQARDAPATLASGVPSLPSTTRTKCIATGNRQTQKGGSRRTCRGHTYANPTQRHRNGGVLGRIEKRRL